jgi:hypothetical protein
MCWTAAETEVQMYGLPVGVSVGMKGFGGRSVEAKGGNTHSIYLMRDVASAHIPLETARNWEWMTLSLFSLPIILGQRSDMAKLNENTDE